MTKTPSTFAGKLAELRQAAGLSQYALAQRAGLTKQSLSLLELGQREPAWETVQRLALALGTDCRAFMDASLKLPELPKDRPGPGRPASKSKQTKSKKPTTKKTKKG